MGYLIDKVNKYSKRILFRKTESKKLYYDVIISSLEGYDLNYIEEQVEKRIVKPFLDKYRRIVLVRIANILSFQIKNKINEKYMHLLKRLVQVLINDLASKNISYGADFELIELYFTLVNLKDMITKKEYDKYISVLKRVNPYKQYGINNKKVPIANQNNLVIYNIVGEYLRGVLTNTDTSQYIEEHWKIQKEKFDLNGMYKDPNNPMLYDLTVRAHLALMLQLGYEGKIKKAIETILMKSSMTSLFYMSTQYIFPYGGRSNSYHMNETLVSSLSEYYANEYYKMNQLKIAGAFKRLARKSIESIKRWDGYHIKNFFENHSLFGCDKYGTYEGYMVTAGCFMIQGYTFCNSNIKEYKTPSEFSGYMLRTTNDFHKLFANSNGYFIEIDYNADCEYDSTGLGRIHKCNIPIELGLSLPFAEEAKYLVGDNIQNKGRTLGPGWYDGEKEVYLATQNFIKPAYINMGIENEKKVQFEITYYLKKGNVILNYSIDKKGVHVKCKCDFANLFYHIPILIDNGKDKTNQEITYMKCINYLNNYWYKLEWYEKYQVQLKNSYIYNRSGIYKSLIVKSKTNEIYINIQLGESEGKNGEA